MAGHADADRLLGQTSGPGSPPTTHLDEQPPHRGRPSFGVTRPPALPHTAWLRSSTVVRVPISRGMARSWLLPHTTYKMALRLPNGPVALTQIAGIGFAHEWCLLQTQV